jgi:hypothetical protein
VKGGEKQTPTYEVSLPGPRTGARLLSYGGEQVGMLYPNIDHEKLALKLNSHASLLSHNKTLREALERLHSIVEFRITMGDLKSGSYRSGYEMDAAMDQARAALAQSKETV